MNDTTPFSDFSRQSPKGILVIYGDTLLQVLKQSWVLAAIFITRLSRFSEQDLQYIYLGIIGIFILTLFTSYLSYRNFMFKVEDNHFLLKKGILKKNHTSIPFDRIQNINFKQNLIQQVINVYGVAIETAGSKKTEITIKALSHDEAIALKNQISITNKTTQPVKEQEKPMLKVNAKELLKVSMTENHLQSLFLFLALLLGFFQQIEQVLDSLGQKKILGTYIDQSSEFVFGSIVLIIIFLFFLIVIAIISSFMRVFIRHFNLVMFVKEDALEINQGLLTKKSTLLKKQKVQSITVSTNPLKRWVGIFYITFKQAISGKVSKKNDKLIRIVGCNLSQVEKVKNDLLKMESIETQSKEFSDDYYKMRMFLQSFLLILLLSTAGYLMYPDASILLINIVLLPLFYFLVQKKFKKRFYKISQELLLVGKGLIDTHHTYFELFKIQNIKLKQTIFQERKQVVDVIIQTASGKIKIPCIKQERANEIYNYLLYKAETNKEPWM